MTPNSRFDRWLMGEPSITEQELAGYQLFKNSGCTACHSGTAMGGTSFQKMGLVEPYQTNNNALGLAGVTGKDVELTYPYFHDGESDTLTDAVDIMGRLLRIRLCALSLLSKMVLSKISQMAKCR